MIIDEGLLKLLIAGFFGSIIGLERQNHGQNAGFRTQTLVCLGSCLVTILSIKVFEIYGKSVDPSRISAQVVVGIGFLGAGAILRYKNIIRGLTTAATLWVVSAIGMAIGFGEYLLSAIATVIVLATLIILKYLENLIPQENYANICIKIKSEDDVDFATFVKDLNIKIVEQKFDFNKQESFIEHTISITYRKNEDLSLLLNKLKKQPEVVEFSVS